MILLKVITYNISCFKTKYTITIVWGESNNNRDDHSS